MNHENCPNHVFVKNGRKLPSLLSTTPTCQSHFFEENAECPLMGITSSVDKSQILQQALSDCQPHNLPRDEVLGCPIGS